MKRYYENTSTYKCVECGHVWKLSVWQWLFFVSMKFDITRHRYVKCPACGVKHWLQAEKVK
jgi:DNA-directed RNA polymerase subunit RPC12/RpoP